ncbi:MAG TPA: exopolysaccharide transport family protein, partial [Candidatus Syntrophosphaera thermopropionivorans]|nr:exopolysaccharide transport family protein [Candidatus Syntrophosphaera thermopropionivorans]
MEQQPIQNIQPPQVEEINLKEYLRIIYQFRYLIVIIFVVVIIGTILYTYQQPRIYSASSKILLENQTTGADILMLTGQGSGKNYINNQIQLIKSKPLLSAAWEIMKKNPEWEAYPISSTENPIGHLGGIKVEALRETDILTLSYESTNPGEAMAVVNAIADAVVQQNNQIARLEYTTVREFLGEQLDLISRRLQASEEDLRAFKNENKIVELSETTKKWIEQSADIESQYESALTDQAVKARTLEVLKKQLKDQDSLMVEVDNVLRAPYIEQLRKDITNTQATIAKLRTNENYSSDHPQIKLLQEELSKTKATLDAEIKKYISKNLNYDPLSFRNQILTKIVQAEVDLEMARTQVQGLEQTKAIFEDRIITLPDKELQLARLTRSMALDEKIYGIMMEKYEDARIAEQAKIGNIRVIDYATRPGKPIKPNTSMNLLVGILLGLGLGVATALIVHSMDTKLRTLEDIESYVRLPIMGTIPLIQESESRIIEFNQMIEQSEGENKEQLSKSLHYVMMQLVSHYAPKSPISEAYRTLRTNILSKKPEGSTSILITSPGPKEGKSTTISNLAITFSQMNAKVILVDLDMRRP